MPNWVCNKAIITGPKADLDRFVSLVKSNESDFDFNKIIPEPQTKDECDPKYYVTSDSHIMSDYDKPWFNWYDWHCDKWGTKWGVSDPCVNRWGDRVHVDFTTAWSFPDGIWERLAVDFPTLTFEVDYADEDLGYNCGTFYANDGGFWYEDPQGNSTLFACNVWGYGYDDIAEWLGKEQADEIFSEVTF